MLENGAIENHQSKTVSPMINRKNIAIAKISLNLENGYFLCSLFLAFAKVNNSNIAEKPAAITHKLE